MFQHRSERKKKNNEKQTNKQANRVRITRESVVHFFAQRSGKWTWSLKLLIALRRTDTVEAEPSVHFTKWRLASFLLTAEKSSPLSIFLEWANQVSVVKVVAVAFFFHHPQEGEEGRQKKSKKTSQKNFHNLEENWTTLCLLFSVSHNESAFGGHLPTISAPQQFPI